MIGTASAFDVLVFLFLVAASCSSERNVLYARIFVKSVVVTKQCIVCFQILSICIRYYYYKTLV